MEGGLPAVGDGAFLVQAGLAVQAVEADSPAWGAVLLGGAFPLNDGWHLVALHQNWTAENLPCSTTPFPIYNKFCNMPDFCNVCQISQSLSILTAWSTRF